MRVKQRGVELPLVISDHADWDELLATMQEVGAPEVWIARGREEALAHAAGQRGSARGRWRWWVIRRREAETSGWRMRLLNFHHGT